MTDPHRVQRALGILICTLGILVAGNNLLNYGIFCNLSLWESLIQLPVYFNLIVVALFAITSFIPSQLARFFQSLLFVITSGLVMLSDGPNSFFAISMFVMGVITIDYYDFSLKNKKLILIPCFLYELVCLSVSISLQTLVGKFLVSFNYLLYVVVSILIFMVLARVYDVKPKS